MKSRIVPGMLLAGLGSLAGAQDAAPFDSRIQAVTLYADRALVTRAGELTVQEGVQRVVLKGLPAWIDTASVRARLEPADAGEIVDVQVRSEFLAKTRDAEVQKAQDELQNLLDQLTVLEDEVGLLQARKKLVEQISTFNLEKIPRDAVTRDIPIKNYTDVVNFVSEEMSTIATRQRELDKQRRALSPEKTVRESRLNELRNKAKLEERHVEISIQGAKAGAAKLAVSYFLAGATWEPVYEVRTDKDQVRLSAFAAITQTTGEDWERVKISLSTQSPGKTVSVPKLEALLVGAGNAGQIFQGGKQAASFNVANNAWIANNSFQAQGKATIVSRNFERQQDVQNRAVKQFNRLQERGTTAIFHALGEQTVRPDGEVVRAPLATYQYEGSPHIIAAPEISLNATKTLELRHQGAAPLLPGRVSLFQQGAFLGMTDVGFVAGGETFTLFAGLADGIKLSRTLDHKKSELRRGKRSNRMKVAFLVTVENLSARPVTVRLADRIPVSDEDDVKISYVSISPSVKPDTDGLLVWELPVPPQSKTEVRINYTIEYPLVRNVDAKSKLMPDASESFDYQIQKLESLF